jgi:hypothetical protein
MALAEDCELRAEPALVLAAGSWEILPPLWLPLRLWICVLNDTSVKPVWRTAFVTSSKVRLPCISKFNAPYLNPRLSIMESLGMGALATMSAVPFRMLT